MFKRARHFRWITLLISLAVESLAFWYGGAPADPGATFSANFLAKLGSPASWMWVGWASLTLAWIWAELAHLVYSNGRRVNRLLDKEDGEELVYETGLHWLVLLRNIRTGKLNDGKAEDLGETLFAASARKSFAWYIVWGPIWLAGLTIVYFVGWLASLAAALSSKLSAWAAAAQSFADAQLTGGFAFLSGPADALIAALPDRLEKFYGLARAETLATFAWLLAIWAAFLLLERGLKRAAPLDLLMRLGGWTTIAAMLFALFATRWFDWLTPLYAFLPEKGLVAMGFFPLTFASAYYVPHILLWSSWRYAIVRDSKTRDSSLMIIGGVLNFDKREFNLQRLVDTHIHQEWWQRLCNIGSIELIETGGGKPEIIWHADNPNRLDLEIKRAIKENRRHAGQGVSNAPPAAVDSAMAGALAVA
jgi:hypothetical protein